MAALTRVLVLVPALLLVTAIAAAPAQAADEPAAASLTISSHNVTYGTAATVVGTVRSAEGTGLPDVALVLEQRASTTAAWSRVGASASSQEGVASFAYAPSRSVDIRLRSSSLDPEVVSPTGRIVVRHKLSQRFADTSILLADNVVATGTITPARPGARVLLQRRVDGEWRTAAGTKAWSNSTYKVWVQVMSPDDRAWRIRVDAAGGLSHADGAATTIAVRPTPNFRVTTVSRSDVRYSWRSGCPVPYTSLRAITMNHRTFGGTFARGTLVVHRNAVDDVRAAFGRAFSDGFVIRSMVPIDRYYDGGRRTGVQADIASMNADNTSAFNCRAVVGHPGRRSAHSWGDAIDINPRENPYVTGGKVYPSGGGPYLNRSDRRAGMVFSNSSIIVELKRRGWTWWGPMRDFHHISRSGG